jgi:hypothetical protein
MTQLHPQFLTKDGNNEFVVLPYEEFLILQERLSDLEDLCDLRTAKQEESLAATISLADLKKELDLD